MPSESEIPYGQPEQSDRRRTRTVAEGGIPSGMETVDPVSDPKTFVPNRKEEPELGAYFSGQPGMRQMPMSPPRVAVSEDADLTDAMVFLNRIKEEYANDLPVYDSFLETMRDFKFGKIDADEVCKGVRILFKEKPHLIKLFDEYLPQYLRFSDSSSRSYEQPKFPPYRGPAFMNPGAMPMNRIMMGQPPHHVPRGTHAPMQGEYMQRPRSTVPLACQSKSGAEAETPKHRLAEDFIHLVKKRYINDPAVYKQFVELLQRSKNGFNKLLSDVSVLFNEAPDLIELFERNFRPASSSDSEAMDPLKAIKDSLAGKGVLEEFLKILNFYNQNYISAADLIFMAAPIINDKDNLKAFKAFIRYEESPGDSVSVETRDYTRIGSYKLFPHPLPLQTPILNNLCVSVSTHDSEGENYVFRNKNNSEELLVRVSDERSEHDLNLGRLKFLIGRLEELYAEHKNGMAEMEDIKMSAALVKETLKQVYEGKSGEVLEAILSNPAKSIPVVLKRLYSIYRENAIIHKQHKSVWRDLINEHYYKAYDTRGVMFRSSEKKFLTLRHIHAESATPFVIKLDDDEMLKMIGRLFCLLVNNPTVPTQKKVSVERQIEYFSSVLQALMGIGSSEELSGDFTFVTDFDYYALSLYICTLYSRFCELKSMASAPLTSSKMAVKLGLQEEYCLVDRFAALVAASESLATRDIDADQYEEKVRFLTESAGYKLYNLRRILSKMERLVLQLLMREIEGTEPLFEGAYAISRKDGVVTLCAMETPAPDGE